MATLISSKSYTSFMATIVLLLGLFAANLDLIGAEPVGVCYGMLGNNLPSPSQVVELCKSRNIRRMRIYDLNHEVLQALRGSNIEVLLGVPNSHYLESLANPSNAESWVQQYVLTYWPSVRFRYIVVGNEVSPINSDTARYAQFVRPALVNVFNAVRSAGLRDQIQISTSIDMKLIKEDSFPPSKGAFRDDVRSYLDPIIGHLAWAKAPLLVSVYPYFSYVNNPQISRDYALFTSPSVVVWDQGRGYQNLFDALLDTTYSALENAGQSSVSLVVSESGWSSPPGGRSGPHDAGTYLSNLVKHVQGGTPKRPGTAIETYLFSLFDENQKEPGVEQNFGIFLPNKQPKYDLNFG